MIAFGSVAFNACVVIQRLQEPQPILAGDTQTHMRVIFASMTTVIVMMLVLLGIYFCLEFYRPAAIVPCIMLICLFFSIVKLDEKLRRIMPNFMYAILLIGSGVLTICSLHLREPLLKANSGINTTTSSPDALQRFPEKEETALRETAGISFIGGHLIFFYFMMAALVKSDIRMVKTATAAAVLSSTDTELISPVDAASAPKKNKTSENSISITSSKVECEHQITHATLHIPD